MGEGGNGRAKTHILGLGYVNVLEVGVERRSLSNQYRGSLRPPRTPRASPRTPPCVPGGPPGPSGRPPRPPVWYGQYFWALRAKSFIYIIYIYM